MISPHLNVNPHKNEAEQTSTKKYPYNKYYQFQDEDSSGRKYIKDTFNMWANPSHQKENPNQSMFNLDRDYQKYCQPNKTKGSKKKVKTKKNLNQSKENLKKKSCNKSVIHSISSVRNSTKRKLTEQKLVKGHSSEAADQLKHYKKLCLDMRKKNTELARQLSQCKQSNKKSLTELQSKVNKLSEKYIDKKQNTDSNKVEKIFESLKHINGKLSKKGKNKPEVSEGEKFYHFFAESLDILRDNGSGGEVYRNKMSILQAQTTWKQILQYLISQDYRLQNYSAKTMR